jgi:alpha/beta superfamily hydrolase
MNIRHLSLAIEGFNIEGELYLPVKEGKATLQAESQGEAYPALCICHGIPSGNPAEPNDPGYPWLAKSFAQAGFASLIFNFRGTGASGGNFDLLGWSRDLEAVLDYLPSQPEINPERLYLMGFSGGAAVSTYVAAHNPKVTALILCACPADLNSLIRQIEKDKGSVIERFRNIGIIRQRDFPLSVREWLEGFKQINPLLWIDQLSPRELFIIHGDQDELVPVSNAWSLYQKAKEPKEIAIIEGGGHRLRLNQQAMKLTSDWLLKAISK